MFTGIIQALGRVESKRGGRLRLKMESPTAPKGKIRPETAWSDSNKISIGASIAVNGACLTVVRREARSLEFDLSPETLRLTNLRMLKPGDRVNLEPALRLGDGLDGHLASGHVDSTAGILETGRMEDGCLRLRVALPQALKGLAARKGSIAINGVSLTVTRLGRNWFETVLIPHTLKATNLGACKPGDLVNLEADLIARYIQSLLKS